MKIFILYDDFLVLITFLCPTRAFENVKDWDTWSLFPVEKSSKSQDFSTKWEIWDKYILEFW